MVRRSADQPCHVTETVFSSRGPCRRCLPRHVGTDGAFPKYPQASIALHQQPSAPPPNPPRRIRIHERLQEGPDTFALQKNDVFFTVGKKTASSHADRMLMFRGWPMWPAEEDERLDGLKWDEIAVISPLSGGGDRFTDTTQ